MNVLQVQVYRRVKASIKISWLKKVEIDVPAKHVACMLSHPSDWDSIEINAETLKEISSLIYEMAEDENSNKQLAEVLLKIAGKHPNDNYNSMTERMLSDRDFALQSYGQMGMF